VASRGPWAQPFPALPAAHVCSFPPPRAPRPCLLQCPHEDGRTRDGMRPEQRIRIPGTRDQLPVLLPLSGIDNRSAKGPSHVRETPWPMVTPRLHGVPDHPPLALRPSCHSFVKSVQDGAARGWRKCLSAVSLGTVTCILTRSPNPLASRFLYLSHVSTNSAPLTEDRCVLG
jgi:hypothetical protein